MEFYATGEEADRLQRGLPQLEAYRTREIISRYLTDDRACVLDVGGGAGAYAFWLAERGHDVHLIDVVPELIARTRERNAAAAAPLNSCTVGDARSLPHANETIDAVLLLGPLYHLTEAEDRARALTEAWRVLRPGGTVFASAITRWAYALHGLERDLFADATFAEAVARIAHDGVHKNDRAAPQRFTTAYFHRPEDLLKEMRTAGFALHTCLGIEGPSGMLSNFDERWSDVRQRDDMVRVAKLLEAEPSLLGMSPHILAVARKPTAAEQHERTGTA